MRSAELAHPPVVLSIFDLPDAQQLLLHGCEDCACAVSEVHSNHPMRPIPPAVAYDSGHWLRDPDVIELALDEEHRLLFDPIRASEVVVVNQFAHRIFSCFEKPSALRDVAAAWPPVHDVEYVFDRLSRLALICPAGKVPRRGLRGNSTGGSGVLTAWLHVTNACNLRCPYCYVNKSREGMDEPVGSAAVAAVIRSAVVHGFPAVKLKYAGGEASLNYRQLMRLHAHACDLAERDRLRLSASLLSNGVRLHPVLVDYLKAQGIKIMISLDGVGDQHDAQRRFANGKPSFRFVERTITQLLAQDLAPHLSITITNRNAGGIADVVRFALERDLTFSLNFFRDNECAAPFADLRYEEQTMISALLDAFQVIEKFLPPWSVLGSILDRGQLLEPRQRPCGVGEDYVVIDQRGGIAKCHMKIEQTLGDVFHDDPLQLVRQDRKTTLNLLVDEKEGCRDCAWRYCCSGGCPVATFQATGRYDIKSPNCNIYKAIYPQALRLEGLRLLKYAGHQRPSPRDWPTGTESGG
jgi:uncharacterized protein